MARRKIIKVGVDMDGVVARHALGGFWVGLRKSKEKLLRKAALSNYYYPTTFFERLGWRVINWLRLPFVDKGGFFPSLAGKDEVRFYLITSRFKFLEGLTKRWLKKHGLAECFEQVLPNVGDINPLHHKEGMIKKLGLDFFVDDDLEVIDYLKDKTRAKLFWVVPGHRKKSDNRDGGVEACRDFVEVLEKIFRI